MKKINSKKLQRNANSWRCTYESSFGKLYFIQEPCDRISLKIPEKYNTAKLVEGVWYWSNNE